MASSSLKQFAVRMKGRGAKVPDRADQIVREVALAADRTVVRATPVDTGRARANWQATLGAPAVGTLDGGAGKRASVASATGRNAGVIAGYKGGRADSAVFLTNNLPYIVPLNNGSSQQAPAGFVERAVDVVLRAARRARLIT
jgi:hypothetical protein